MGLKSKADPVYFISLVGAVEKGFVEQNERVFDLYTKMCDFTDIDVQVISEQDLSDF